MRLAIEVVGAHDVGDTVRSAVLEQEPAQHRLLGLERMRRHFQGFELGVVGHTEEPARNASILAKCQKKGPSPALDFLACSDDQPAGVPVVSPSTATTTLAWTSLCSATTSGNSPTCFNGPSGMRTIAFSTEWPRPCSASTMSTLVTEPNRRPSTPAFCVICTLTPSSLAALSCACATLAPAAFSSSARLASISFRFSGVARLALPWGIRKLRAKPCLTLTTSPRSPTLGSFSRSMTCMV